MNSLMLAATAYDIIAWILVIVVGGTGLVAVILTAIAAMIVAIRWLWYVPTEADEAVKKMLDPGNKKS